MDWKKLLEALLPGLLQFLEGVAEQAGGKGGGKITAAVYISQHALAIAGVPLPSHDQVISFIEDMVRATQPGGQPGNSNQVPQSGVSQPNVGVIIQPS